MMTKLRYFDSTSRLVLVVDDEFVNREILGNIVKREYGVIYAEDGEEAYEMIQENSSKLSAVLMDLNMPKMNGFELLRLIKNDDKLSQIPVIVLTSDESAEVESLNAGASDFIKKPYNMPEVILTRIRRIVELHEGKSIIESAEKDELTGLYNRNFFYEYCEQIERFNPEIVSDAVVLNIEHFHLVNEMYGREFGDKVLKIIADTIKDFIGDEIGIGCRHEGDIFYICCPHTDSYAGLLESILKNVESMTHTSRIRMRVGVYENVRHGMNMERRFSRAKLACNTLRDNFSKSIAYYDDKLREDRMYSERLINDMKEGLEKKQFKVYFQPKYKILEKKPVLASAEALIRWDHPEFGMISPGTFIPLFETNGLIQKLDYYVWQQSGATIKKWKEKFGVKVPVSVNVSRIDIYDPELENKFLGIIRDNDLTPEDMLLEITESAYSEDSEQLISVIGNLQKIGFKVEMDDFGSGYSSLNMLMELPVDVLKLDMKFVRNMLEGEKNLKLVELIMDIAGYLSVPVIAEGVETEAQCQKLRELGCAYVQGYYFSKPVPPEEFEIFIEENK